jgi:curved DNA-binding protein CbpA
MSGEVDYYAVLSVSPNADEAIIRAAYRVLAKRHHPDLVTGREAQSTAKFRLIAEAYETLCDVDCRARYDEQRSRRQRDKGGSRHNDAPKCSSWVLRNGSIVFQVFAIVVACVVFVNVLDTVWIGLSSRGEPVQAIHTDMPQHTPQTEAVRNEPNYDAQGSKGIGPTRPPVTEAMTKSAANGGAEQKRKEQAQIASAKGGERPSRIQADRADAEKGKQASRSGAIAPTRAPTEGNARSTISSARTSEAAPRRSNCASPDGTQFSITNLNGVATVAYNGAPPVQARIDYQGLDMVMLSKIVPDDRIAIGVMKGDMDATVVIVSDGMGNSTRTVEASCFGVAY